MTRSLAIFAAANLGWLALTGVRTGGDTGLYLDGARRLIEGQALIDREPSYLGYIAVVATVEALGGGLLAVVLLQIAAATAAAGAVYRMAAELGGTRVAVVATGLFTIDVDVNRWHTYVLADSLYLSALTISVWLVYRAGAEPLRAGRCVAALVALLTASLIRPEGWFVMPFAGLYWVACAVERPVARLAGSMAVAGACVLAAWLVTPSLTGNVAAVDPAAMLRRGQTIWDYDGWRLEMPASDRSGAVAYALDHPLATAQLMAARVAVHLAHVRPFYSTAHNLVVGLWLLPVYLLTAIAAWALWRHPLTRWCAIAFGSQALVVALTHADWDGRYLAHVMPMVYPFAAAGGWMLVERVKS